MDDNKPQREKTEFEKRIAAGELPTSLDGRRVAAIFDSGVAHKYPIVAYLFDERTGLYQVETYTVDGEYVHPDSPLAASSRDHGLVFPPKVERYHVVLYWLKADHPHPLSAVNPNPAEMSAIRYNASRIVEHTIEVPV